MKELMKIKFNDLVKNLLSSYKYWIVYLILILIAMFSMFNIENYIHPKFELIILLLVSIISIFSIVYYYKHGKHELYKLTFILLLLFGLICAFTVPIDSVSDEYEHFTRAEITSRGILFPEYVDGNYESISSLTNFYLPSHDKTVFQVGEDTQKINTSISYHDSAFEQNPFYGYIFSAIGIGIAKLLDLNVIWMLWLGRIFNVIMYAGLVSLAIKKTPIFKIQLFAISCLPVCLFQAFSLSIDSFIAGLGIFTVAYFFKMSVNKFDRKDIIVFSVLCLLIGLCKLPYLALIFLILFLPKDNFKENKYYFYCILSIVLVSIIGLLWNNLIATPALYHSWRNTYFIQNNVNVSNQINYILLHPYDFIIEFLHLFNSIPYIFGGFFTFYSYTIEGGQYVASAFISFLLTLFVAFISIYPDNTKINLKSRIGTLIVFIIIYVGTFIVQLLSWSPVGQLTLQGALPRYFLVLFALLPFIFSNYIANYKNQELDRYTFVLVLFFISSMLISFAVKYY